ncbi:MAG: serpin family protein [Lachnospiraceae bacterium]|nr:serpin family protein [Lachnospiraceae bacterium]
MRKIKKVTALLVSVASVISCAACAVPEKEKQILEQEPVAFEGQEGQNMREEKEESEKEYNEQKNAAEEEQKETVEQVQILARAEYPEMVQYPVTDSFMYDEKAYTAWRTSVAAQQPESMEYQNGIREFYETTMQEFLKDTEGKNRIYSPLNVYMALAMLAETTDGESRSQILQLLHVDSMEKLRDNAAILWNANYCDDGTVTSRLASSIWLKNGNDYNTDTLQVLAENYYASSFQGNMGSEEYNKVLQNWLNEQTGGLLKEQASTVGMDPETIVALASTVYFQAKWQKEFWKENNTKEIFHAASGDLETEFMHQSSSDYYYWGEQFSAITRNLRYSGEMLLILPEEDVNVEELLSNQEVLDFIYKHEEWENQKYLIVNQSIPKFDVASDYSLIHGLKNLGVTNVFDRTAADFTPLTLEPEVAVDKATHAARVMIDEEGCTAAAFTVMVAAGAGRPPEETVDFVLDRPFLFVINGQDGQPLFVGIVNQPK